MSDGPRSRVRSRALLGVPLLVCLALGPAVAGSSRVAALSSCTTFDANASAEGARIAYSSPGFIVVESLEAGADSAQAHLDSFGTSTAYAAYPDPGDEVLSLIPLVGSLAMIDLPRAVVYPLFAESSYPSTPEGRVTSPAINLSANSAAESSQAVADSGLASGDLVSGAGLVRASAHVDCAATGEVTATSESTVEVLGLLDGLLQIGPVHASASVVRAADGTQTVDSHLEIARITVLGQTIAVTDKGIEIGGTVVPLENPLVDVLKSQGIELTYLDPIELPNGEGVVAPGLQIKVTKNVTGFADTAVTLTLGRAFASIGLNPAGVAPPSSDDVTPPVVPSASTGTTYTPGSTSSTPAPQPVARTVATPSAPAEVAAPVPAAVATTLFSSSGLYATVVVGSITLLVGSLLFRKLGVRLGWT